MLNHRLMNKEKLDRQKTVVTSVSNFNIIQKNIQKRKELRPLTRNAASK